MIDTASTAGAIPGSPRARPRGFTLVELLVAIGIMALVAIISWRGLASLIATRDRIGPENDDLRSLLTAFGQLQLDLASTANPVIMSLGTTPVVVQVVDGAPTLRILRIAPPLPDGASAVQQVVYSVRDGDLLRQASDPSRVVGGPAAGATEAPAPLRLVAGVTQMRVRVWRNPDGWMVPAEADPTPPPGVEVEITRGDGSRYRRVMRVG